MDMFVCNSIGHVAGGVIFTELDDGKWQASCAIGNVFGENVYGEHTGKGATKEAAALALKQEIKDFEEMMWT